MTPFTSKLDPSQKRVGWISLATLLAGLGAAASLGADAPSPLTRKAAFQLLKTTGFKWKETDLPIQDASAKKAEARSFLLPHVSFAVREYAGRVNPVQYGMTTPADLTLFLAGSVGFVFAQSLLDISALNRIEAAEANQKRSAAMSAQYKSDLTYLMLAQYLNAQRLQKKIETINSNIARGESIEKIAEVRVSSGLGLSLDLMRARSLLAAEKYKKTDAVFAFTKANQELANTLGQSSLTVELEPLHFAKIAEKDTQIPAEDAIDSRADIISASKTLEAAMGLVAGARSESIPKIALVGDVGYVGASPLGLGQFPSVPTGMLAIQLSVPIYTGGLNSAHIQAEGVKVIKAENDLREAELAAQSQIRLALAQLQQTQSAVDVSGSHVTVAQEELKLVQKRFTNGAVSGLEISNSEVNLAGALDMNLEAICGYELSKLNYYRAIGRLSTYLGNSEGAL